MTMMPVLVQVAQYYLACLTNRIVAKMFKCPRGLVCEKSHTTITTSFNAAFIINLFNKMHLKVYTVLVYCRNLETIKAC